jgi:hypothetical protein
MKRYILDAEGKVQGEWKGKFRDAVLQAPQGCGCVAGTDHTFVFSANGWTSSAQATVALDKMDEGKKVTLHNLKPRQRERQD